MQQSQASSHSPSLCADFILQSISTWTWLSASSTTGISLDEESITDINLISLALRHPFEIRTQKVTKRKEGVIGADWEWWVESHGLWLGLRVQAKKLDPRTMEYPGLPKWNVNGRQVDLLIDDATKSSPPLLPIYVLYNYWDTSRYRPHPQCNLCPSYPESLGCGLSHAEHVKSLVDGGSKELKDLSKNMYPWSCLVCCGDEFTSETDLPIRVLEFMKSIAPARNERTMPKEPEYPTKTPPEHVRLIADGERLSEAQWSKLDIHRIIVMREYHE